ncbi:DUF3159 domain-containing protein [Microbacterium sp. NC79]|uniref:DUF3159 domain-containing protein n=1 Tax=Microbacterium sp. NC79 TaxID=2851009 RepID=UPI001C2BCC15|nr:DUF3159 domain-containing protein [Microbacterium sp. NC79]
MVSGGNSEAPSTAPEPKVSDVLSAALGEAARRAGLDPAEQATTGHVVWGAMGGWRGVVESVVPSLIFIATFAFTQDAWLAIGVSVAVAAVFTVARLVAKTPPAAAIGGLIAAIIAAGFALFTGKAENNFIPGFLTNAAYGSGLLISALIGWSIIGLIGGYLMSEGTAWRRSKRKRRVYFWLTVAWAGLFFARLAVQVPIYLQGEDALATLATVKLVMGIPLFAPMVAVTWLAVRSLYAKAPPATDAAPTDTEPGTTPAT